MTTETQPKIEEKYEVASAVKRLINYVIDGMILNLLMLFVPVPDAEAMADFIIISSITGVVFFLYYFISESLFQRTPAKFITRTKVVFLDGSKPGMGTVALRTLCRLVPYQSNIDKLG